MYGVVTKYFNDRGYGFIRGVHIRRKAKENISLAMQIRLLGMMKDSRDLLRNLCMSKGH